MPKRIFRSPVLILLILFFALFFLPEFLSLYIDWLWFRDVGLEQIFSTRVRAQALSALCGALGGFLFSYAHLWFALRAMKGREVVIRLHGQEVPQLDFLRHIERVRVIVPVFTGLFSAALLNGSWMTFLSYFHQAAAGYADPIFGKDVSFYFFTLPAQEVIANALGLVLWVTLAGVALTYFVKAALFITRRGLVAERTASAHLSLIGSMILAVIAWKTFIGMHTILSSSHGHVAGATYTDVHAVIPFMKAQMIMALALAGLFAANVLLRRTLVLLAGVAVYIVVSFIGSSVYPAILQKFVVAPNELVKETPYIKHNIASTRKAFGLDGVEERDISGSTSLNRSDITNNSATIKNIRLWDHRPLLDTFSQIQEIRTYYEFASVGNDRYMINGEYRQTMLSPRELSTESIPTRNWINETLSFTHGYGLTLGPVNQVTPEGLPVLFIKDIPPVSSVGTIKVSRPEIYFGRLSSEYVIANTKSKEFDYPSGEENVFTEYSGTRGVKIDSVFKKLAFAAHFRSMKLLFSNDVTRESKVLFHRNIIERVRTAMPFLMFDSDPYMVISDDGRLFWICDGYTVSSRFPYSQQMGRRINYIRNSVKITVDAYDGTMMFYMADPKDPLVRTIASIFHGALKPLSEMPADLKRHIRYPLNIFDIQTKVYSVYHMDDPQIFYNREDQWEIPALGTGGKETMESYYTIMKLPGEKKEEFILMLPFNPKKKDNLAAWMVARSDGEEYGKMIVYRFPKDRLVYGPKQIMARINQDTEISRQLSLWDQRGSKVILGTLLVIPIENSLIYVQPLYLRAESGKIPELKRVIVAYENRIAMEETLDAALSRIFGEVRVSDETLPVPAARPAAAPVQKGGFASQALQHYERAMKAQREGDWALYGEEIRKLGEAIRKMQP